MTDKPKITEERDDRRLSCVLTDEEFRTKSEDLAVANDDMASLEDAKKAVASDYKSRIEAVAGKIGVLSTTVRNGAEFRDVPCLTTFDFTKGKVVTIREDTGEELENREMKAQERLRQKELFPKEEESPE